MERQGVCLALLLVSVSVLFIESRASNDAVSHVGLDWQEADALNTFLGLPEDEDEDEQSESPSDGDISHIRPPTFMLRMYEWRKQREKMLADFARAFTYGPAALCATPELTTIRSYPFKGVTSSGWMEFRVDQLRSKQQLCNATLRLHFSSRSSLHRTMAPGPPLLVRVEVIEHTLDPTSDEERYTTRKVVAQSHVVSRQRLAGWLRINMNAAFTRATPGSTKRFETRLRILGGQQGIIQISTRNPGRNSPLLVLYAHEPQDESSESLFEQLQSDELYSYAKDNSTMGMITVLARSSRSIHKRIEHIRNRGPPTANNVRCGIGQVQVRFSELGLSAVVQPRAFNLTFCKGHCRHVIPAQSNPNRHGQLMSLLNAMSKRRKHQIPAPCCGPIKLIGMDFMYWTRAGALEIRYHPDVTVRKCGCW